MKICIVNPPQVEPEMLPLGAAKLAATLQQRGNNVEMIDANQQVWNRWLDPQHLQRQAQDMRQALDRLGSRDTVAGFDAWMVHRAVRGTVGFPLLLEAITPARAELGRLEPGARRGWARRIIESALDIALWPAPGTATLNDLTLMHSTESSADVLEVARSDVDNLFSAFWTTWIDARHDWPEELVLWLETDQQLIPAATLAHIVRARHPQTRLRLAGPFSRFLALCVGEGGSAGWQGLFDGYCDVSAAQPTSLGADQTLIGFLTGLASQRVLGAPVVSLASDATDADGAPGLLRDLCHLHQACPTLQLHVGTPLPVPTLAALAEGLGVLAPGARWSTMVKFGFRLDRTTAARLQAAGCCALHFEIKGFAGYDLPPEPARDVLLQSLAQARSTGLPTLASVVYGFPSDAAASFAQFVSTMRQTIDSVDRWVRFRVYRLYRFSEAWRNPQAWGITQVFEPPSGSDWCRHVDFVTRSGLDSRQFHQQALELLSKFGARAHDFPPSPTLGDDAGIGATPSQSTSATAAFSEQDRLEAIPADALQSVHFDFSAMDKVYGTHVPGPGRRWPEQCFAAGQPTWLARGFSAERLTTVGAGTVKLLQMFQAPAPASEIASRLARVGDGDGHALLRKLVQSGLMRVRGTD